MGWFSFGRKKHAKPLVPGRDRSSTGLQRPTYSYYAARSSAGQPRRPVRETRASASQPAKSRVSGQHVIIVLCSLAVVFSLGNVFRVSNNSRVVQSTSTEAYQLSDTALETYEQAANELLASSVLNRFKLTVNSTGIAAELKARYPELESVVLTLPLLGNRPVLYVAPTNPVFALETPAGNFSLDKNGYVLTRLTGTDTSLIALKDTSARVPKPGQQYLASSITTFAFTMYYQLTEQSVGTVAYLDLPVSAPYELVVHFADKPYYVRSNLRADAMQQSGAVVATLEYLEGRAPGQYLDVRTPGRAYYK